MKLGLEYILSNIEKSLQSIEYMDKHINDSKECFFGFFMYAPLPMWIKKVDITSEKTLFKMLVVNKEFFNMFKINSTDYTGFTDIAVWDSKTAQVLLDSDNYVYRTKGIFSGKEIVYLGNEKEEVHLFTLKWPLFNESGHLSYIVGLCIKLHE